jgi:hypothetical protein
MLAARCQALNEGEVIDPDDYDPDFDRPWELGEECPHLEWHIGVWKSWGELGEPVVVIIYCSTCHASQELEMSLGPDWIPLARRR